MEDRPARAEWLGGGPSLVHLHVPRRHEAVAAALLVPAMGYEYVCSHRSLRTLAERLSDAGVLTLRLDPPGIGDASEGLWRPEVVESWQVVVREAAAYVRATSAVPLIGIGLRLGALIVGAESDCFDAAVLWDPVVSARQMIRESQLVQHFANVGANGEGTAGETVIAGVVLPEPVVGALRVLRLPDVVTAPCLALLRPDRPDAAARRALDGWTDVLIEPAVGQDAMLDAESSTALVPHATLERITAWVAGAGGTAAPVSLAPPTTEAVVEGPTGPVEERLVTLGTGRLFGVVTEPVGRAAPGAPLLVCLTNAADVHQGPGRAWVNWGRSMASRGWRVARIDTPGIGDSPTPPGSIDDQPFPAAAVGDLAAAIDELRLDPEDPVVVLGMCSGGRLALPVGERVDASMVVAINAPWHTPEPLLSQIHPQDPYPAAIARRDRRRLWYRLAALVPDPVQRRASALGLGPDGARELRRALEAGRRVLFVYGETSFNLSRARATMHWALHALERSEGSGLAVVADLDHALLAPGPRDAALETIETYLAAWKAPLQTRPPVG